MSCHCNTITQNLSLVAGESETLVFHLRQKDGRPYDATGYTAVFSASDFVNRGDTPAIFLRGVIDKDTVTVTMTPFKTMNLLDVRYDYQLILWDGSGELEVAAEGSIYVKYNACGAYLITSGGGEGGGGDSTESPVIDLSHLQRQIDELRETVGDIPAVLNKIMEGDDQ